MLSEVCSGGFLDTDEIVTLLELTVYFDEVYVLVKCFGRIYSRTDFISVKRMAKNSHLT